MQYPRVFYLCTSSDFRSGEMADEADMTLPTTGQNVWNERRLIQLRAQMLGDKFRSTNN